MKARQKQKLMLLMKEAHSFAKTLTAFNGDKYQKNLSLALKVKAIDRKAGKSTIKDVNFIKSNIPSQFVKLFGIQDCHNDSRYTIYHNLWGKSILITQYKTVDQSYMNNNPYTYQRNLD